MQRILDRFLKYVQVDTQSDPNNPAFPSTEKQWDLARILYRTRKHRDARSGIGQKLLCHGNVA